MLKRMKKEAEGRRQRHYAASLAVIAEMKMAFENCEYKDIEPEESKIVARHLEDTKARVEKWRDEGADYGEQQLDERTEAFVAAVEGAIAQWKEKAGVKLEHNFADAADRPTVPQVVAEDKAREEMHDRLEKSVKSGEDLR